MEYTNAKQGITVSVPKGLSLAEALKSLRQMADRFDRLSEKDQTYFENKFEGVISDYPIAPKQELSEAPIG